MSDKIAQGDVTAVRFGKLGLRIKLHAIDKMASVSLYSVALLEAETMRVLEILHHNSGTAASIEAFRRRFNGQQARS